MTAQEHTPQSDPRDGTEPGAALHKQTNRRGLLRAALGTAAASVGAGALLETQTGGAQAAGAPDNHFGQSTFGSNTSGPTVTVTNNGSGYGLSSTSLNSIAVYGTSNDIGVYGIGVNGAGVYGAGGNFGVEGQSSNGYGVSGSSSSTSGTGVFGFGYTGVYGNSSSSTASGNVGVTGRGAAANGTGLAGYGYIGLYAQGSLDAGFFEGNVSVQGTLSKTAGTFKIDHPLAPDSKYLYHSFVESPDMKNIYDGVVTLDADGRASVELPAWFEALNKDVRYQLTAIGAPAPHLHIATKVRGNRFTIAGGVAGSEVSWQVTGVRQDAWATAHRVEVEVDKPAEEQGYYLHPELFGAPPERAVATLRKPAEPQSAATPSGHAAALSAPSH